MRFSPYEFVRATTLLLAVFWTLRGLARTIGFARNWEHRLFGWGMSRRWLRLQIAKVAVRATVLDPVNLALAALLLALWVGPARGWFRLSEWRGALAPRPALVIPEDVPPDVAPAPSEEAR